MQRRNMLPIVQNAKLFIKLISDIAWIQWDFFNKFVKLFQYI